MAFPALLSEVSLGPAVLRNRVVSTAHQTGLVHDHLPTDDLVAYHEARARGGVGAIFLEATAVAPSRACSRPTRSAATSPGSSRGYERARRGASTRHGDAAASCSSSTAAASRSPRPPRAPAVAPSAVPTPRFTAEPRALTRPRSTSSSRATRPPRGSRREGGIDGIEVSMAHGYLAAQFFAAALEPRATTATTARSRRGCASPREVLAAVRAEARRRSRRRRAPRRPTRSRRTGSAPSACAEIAARARATGLVDFVSLALGHSATYRGSTLDRRRRRPAAETRSPGPLARDARGVAGGVPLIAHDARRRPRRTPSGSSAAGAADARRHDPRADRRPGAACARPRAGARRRGDRVHRLQPGLHRPLPRRLPIACVVNPRTGRERTLAAPRRAAARGGACSSSARGPAGRRGGARGGRARRRRSCCRARGATSAASCALAGRAPAHREMWERCAALDAPRGAGAAGVDVRLGTEARRTTPRTYDAVVLATGARPYAPAAAGRDPPRARSLDAPGTRSRPRRGRRGRCSSPTGAAAGTGSTRRRRSPSTASR